MKIGNWSSDSNATFVIAEIGNNHEGSVELAEKLIALAAEAGADAVKFQTIVPDRLVAPTETARIAQLEKLCLKYDAFPRLKKAADAAGVVFMSTPFDLESAHFLNDLVPAFKIASGDNNFFPLIREVASFKKPMILSSGLTNLPAIRATRDFIASLWGAERTEAELAILHCVVNYPTALEHANLNAITDLRKLGSIVGYSDHTIGIEAATLSVALGAKVIEKHFTISKTHSAFRDHQLSADPADLKALIAQIRNAEKMLGTGKHELSENEKAMVTPVRRSIAARRDLTEGKTLEATDLIWIRPGSGLAPGREAELVGRKLKRSLKRGELFALSDVGAS